jgi:DNA polymerase-3 subunit epsilon
LVSTVRRRLLGLDRARERALKRTPPGPLRDYLETPFPDRNALCRDVDIVALDLETTGLDIKTDSILSAGLVCLRQFRVRLSSAWYQVIKVDHDIPEASAVIHEITDDQAAAGEPIERVLPQLLRRLAGKVMLAHFARVEQSFIDAACRRLYGGPFLIPTIDSLILAQRLFELRNHSVQVGDLRLFNLRPRFNLPRYKAHNALNDALCTAELFLALAGEIAPSGQGKLKDFLTN